MLYLERAQKTLSSKAVSLRQFLQLHLTVEGIIKRLLFIGLRNNRVQYKTAQVAIGEYYEGDKTSIVKKAWDLCGIDYEKIVSKDRNYKIMENLYWEFSSQYRNLLVHGNDDALRDKELLKTVMQVDKKFIDSIEMVLKTQNKPSLFEQPRKWKIGKGTIADVDDVFKNYLGTKRPKKPTLTLEEVKKQLSQVK
ncbi:hypothetical protein AGMMS50230_16350 [Spirochaetia bacterium]|nr:hypothetical protein AGMMS50230_16350 [Spirochaetia bacterium]